jgi:hypothetical protein
MAGGCFGCCILREELAAKREFEMENKQTADSNKGVNLVSEFAEKVAVVTGVATGLGEAIGVLIEQYFKSYAGFVWASFHASEDGQRGVNYNLKSKIGTVNSKQKNPTSIIPNAHFPRISHLTLK